VINGILAMSEIAIVSSRKARLHKLESDHRKGAKSAILLHDNPSHFFSTIQVGITSVGILSGAIGENAFTIPLHEMLVQIPYVSPYAEEISLTLTVIIITYFSVVMGELVPKRLAMRSPETIALIIAPPMTLLAKLSSPLVWLLSSSSNLLLWIFRMHRQKETSVTNEEIKIMMKQGAEAGVFHESEQQIVANVLKLDEQRVGAIMTPQKKIYFIDLNDTEDSIFNKIIHCHYSHIVICKNGLENVVGILRRSDLLNPALNGDSLDIEKYMHIPLYIPDIMTIPYLLDTFRKARTQFAFIVNEYGEMKGIVTLSDVLSAIMGDFPSEYLTSEPEIVQRDDGSWLVDGGISLVRLKAILNINSQFPNERSNNYNTLAGFIMSYMERIPNVADHFEYAQWRYEIVDMDTSQIDKVLMNRVNPDISSNREN
jgi:putative hemolysin